MEFKGQKPSSVILSLAYTICFKRKVSTDYNYQEERVGIHKQCSPSLFAVTTPSQGRQIPTTHIMVFSMANDLRSEVIVRFVDVGRIVDHLLCKLSFDIRLVEITQKQCVSIYIMYVITISTSSQPTSNDAKNRHVYCMCACMLNVVIIHFRVNLKGVFYDTLNGSYYEQLATSDYATTTKSLYLLDVRYHGDDIFQNQFKRGRLCHPQWYFSITPIFLNSKRQYIIQILTSIHRPTLIHCSNTQTPD